MQSISRRVSSDLDGQAGGGTRLVRISHGSVPFSVRYADIAMRRFRAHPV